MGIINNCMLIVVAVSVGGTACAHMCVGNIGKLCYGSYTVSVCACVRACARARAIRIVSRDKRLHFTNTLIIIIISNASYISVTARLKGRQLSSSGKVQYVDRQFRPQCGSQYVQSDGRVRLHDVGTVHLNHASDTLRVSPSLQPGGHGVLCNLVVSVFSLSAMLYCVIWSFRYLVCQPCFIV